MAINQITVFLENRAGKLLEVTKILSECKVDLRAINIAETADYGLLRIIAADTDLAEKVLKENGLICTKTPVIAVAVPDKPGGLNDMLEILAKENIDVNYMYSIFGHIDGLAYMILQLSDIDNAQSVLTKNGVGIANAKDLLDKGVKIEKVSGHEAAFSIIPADGSYKVSFGEDEFVAFFKEFLRPQLIEMLF